MTGEGVNERKTGEQSDSGFRQDDKHTAHLLRVLGSAWLLEPDQAMLDRLSLLPGLEEISGTITPERAALEFSRLILQLVPPYASLFLDPEAMLNGDVTEQVELEYRQHNFRISPEWRAGPLDHLGLELHFLAHLLLIDRSAAKAFLTNHLLHWAPICLLAFERIESGRLYPALGRLTLDVLCEISRQA